MATASKGVFKIIIIIIIYINYLFLSYPLFIHYISHIIIDLFQKFKYTFSCIFKTLIEHIQLVFVMFYYIDKHSSKYSSLSY